MKKWHDDRHASVPSLLADDLGIGVDQWDHTVIVELFRKEMISGVLVGLEQSMAQREKYEFIVPGSVRSAVDCAHDIATDYHCGSRR